ncbi:MAG: P-II family nitrogen regulator [Thermochromatium sp.]
MKFAVLVAVLAEELEEKAIDIAKQAGAGGMTILDARGISAQEKKSFFGLTYEGAQSVLLMVLEKKLSLSVMKALRDALELRSHSQGIVFTIPLEHISGIDMHQIEQFEDRLKTDL